MNLDERMASLQNKLNDKLNRLNGYGVAAAPSYNAGGAGASQTAMPQQAGPGVTSCVQGDSFCPECGNKIPSDSLFCPECGHNIAGGNSCDKAVQAGGGAENEGVIMTDTRLLALKYRTDRECVKNVISLFINQSLSVGFTWYLLDIADHQDEIGEATWMDYSDVLQNFCRDNGIETGPKLSLFIIGGNDVIPQPCEDNPCYSPSPWGDDEYQAKVYADFYYCFYGQLQLDFLDCNRARCNVSRLPLESGEMASTLEDDLGGYFGKALQCMDEGGIKIGRAVMTSNVDWIPASREMSRNLPTESLENTEDEVLDNMYISPDIMVDMDDELREQYYSSLSTADMLVFNLHGACQPEMSGFYSSGLAFSTYMLRETNAKIFNTVACWGGRYIKYSRNQSMLLNAMHRHNVLLYSGACVPALGKCGNYQNDATWRIQPAAYSETFMARFSEYQCIGTMSSGEAFLRAKCDYYNTSRAVEEDEYTLATVLMFNLYGCPALRTKPNVHAIAEIQNEDGSKACRIPFRPRKKEVVMECGANGGQQRSSSILDAVRGAVDSNLQLIHETIVDKLYNALGVTPRELFRVEKYSTVDTNGNTQKGYLYHYDKQRFEDVRSHIEVALDEAGNIRSAIQTK